MSWMRASGWWILLGVLALSGGPEARAATISGFNPSGGPTGTEVVVSGTGLQTATFVYFGATEAPGEIVSRAATSVRVRVPANAFTGPISVFTSASGAATSSQVFVAAPRITDFTPKTGSPGTLVTLDGVNFATGLPGGRGNVTEVRFNGQLAEFQASGLGQILTVVPPNGTSGPIRVVNEAGSFTTFVPFEVVPQITQVLPIAGQPGEVVEVRGRNLGSTLRVEFGAVPAPYSVLSSTNLMTVVPTNAVNGRIQVVTPAGVVSSAEVFKVRPRIISFNPVVGNVGTNVTLQGGGFQGATEVTFNGVKASSLTVRNSQTIDAVVPNGATTGPLRVVTPNGTNTTESLFYLPARLTSFTPGTGQRGDTITLDGQNLTGTTGVFFGGVEAAAFTVVSPTRVTAVVPAAAVSGRIRLVHPSGEVLSSGTFNVRALLDGFAPASGVRGIPVTLSGAGLTNVAQVRLGDAETTFLILDPTQIRAIVPLTAFSGPWSLRTTGGQEVSAPGVFVVTDAVPVLTEFAPASGGVGTQVVLQGQGLRTTSRVEFQGVSATFTVSSGSQVTATVPAGAKTGLIAVTTLDGIAVSSTVFTVPSGQPVSMTVQRQGNLLVLRWPVDGTEYEVESTPVLGAGANWQAESVEPVMEGNQWRVELPLPTVDHRYFRLRR